MNRNVHHGPATGAGRRRRTLLAGASALALAFTLGACSGGDPLEGDGPQATGSGVDRPLVIGSADFTESQIIAELYAGALNAADIEATTTPGIGAREAYVGAVQDGSADVVPDYSGNLLLFFDASATAVAADEIIDALGGALPEGLGVLEASSAEDKDALVVTQATAERYGLTSIEDLTAVCDELVFGAPPEFQERAYGLPGLAEKYSCTPKSFEPIADGGGPLTVQALISDQVQVADIFTTSPSIAENALVVLEDPKNNFIAQQVLPLVNTEVIGQEAADVLNNVSRQLSTEDLLGLNSAVSGDAKLEPAEAAEEWLREKGFIQ
ncbi:ABC transporter substrate-binding protein [Zafaria sp. J156]|uniref:ABC transporter substrate-binding protein n=1 Tax=Zafaria sp. J156 TaxID=3116490 RepID=UPI002E75CFC4|nr:ABC transporter substrate-binding protein [Zafaria sp. J156]MEE1620436.1 ABC transporter substrate-binding protein [Zafaria sp. J156]